MEQVNFDELIRATEFLNKINQIDLQEIKWVRDNGEVITYDTQWIKNWRFVGLTNVYFAREILTEIINGNEKRLLEEWQRD